MSAEKAYFVFLPADHLAILDTEKSVAEVELMGDTGQVMKNRSTPHSPIYKKIDSFAVKDIELPHLFQCLEIFSLVCTENFRDEAIKRNLQGIAFTPLDEAYKYDPCAGW